MSTKRRWVIEQETDPETGEPTGQYDREQLLGCMEEVEHVLYMVGGMAAFTAERVQVGELGGEPIAVSRRVIVDWSAFAPMRREMEDDEPTSPELEEAAAALAAEIAATEPDEEPDEEVDRSLTTTGPPREDATL
jgi:hypothetical protein